MLTDIENIITIKEKQDDEKKDIDVNMLSEYILDLSLPSSFRIKILNIFYEKNGIENTIDLINKIITMYSISGTKILRQYLIDISDNSNISEILKILCIHGLHDYNEKDEYIYKCIDKIYPRLNQDLSTSYKIDLIKILMKNEDYKDKTLKYFINILQNEKLKCDYIYKLILSLENKYEYFLIEGCKYIIFDSNRDIKIKILACQNLLYKKINTEDVNNIQNLLLSFANDGKLDYNIRADATDILLKSENKDIKSEAEKIINILGNENNTTNNIYNNKQNVHIKEIEESSMKILENLQTLSFKNNINIIDIENDINTYILENNIESEKIKLSLNRIKLDRSLYSIYNCRLEYILIKVYSYIKKHKYESEMKKRLIEELIDMSGTCSSGFANRLINSITGFGDFTITISWRDQISSNLCGRLNSRIRDMDNLRLQEKILSEMTIDCKNYEKRKHFLKFFRNNISEIREEMYIEFKEYITDTDFDLYFRDAISFYENGEYI